VADLDADREDDSLAASKLQAQVSSLQALLRARDREVVAAEHALRVLTQQAGAVATSFEQAEHADAQARAAWAASAAATDAGLEDTQQRLVATSQWAEQLHDQGRSASSSLSAEVAQLWNELAAARSENAQLNQDAESAGAARQASSAEAAALQEALAAAQQEVVRHRQEAESAGAARQASSAKAAALQEALAAAQQEVAQHRQETESAGAARDALSAEAAALHVALTAAQRESAGQIAELQEALQQQSQESTQIAAGAKREADQLAAERQSLQEQVRVYAQLQILNKLCPLYYYCIV
jgi:chromosome segregation ATPase